MHCPCPIDDTLNTVEGPSAPSQEYIAEQGGNDDDCDEKADLINRATELRDKKKEVTSLARQGNGFSINHLDTHTRTRGP